MSETVALDVELKSPIERVWQALTDPATLSKWMMFETKDFRPVVGHKFQFRMEPDPSWIIVVDTVTWTLEESESGGTRLHMEQSGFRSEAKKEIGGAKASWTRMLQQLEALLAS